MLHPSVPAQIKTEGVTPLLPDVAVDARWAVQACVARGYEVAIASAGCKAAFVKTFLQHRVDPDIFNDAFFTTPAFQTCVVDKTVSMTRIVQYYGIDDARQCAILFDDIQYNTRYATSIGAGAVYVDNGALEFKARFRMHRTDATPTILQKLCSPDFGRCMQHGERGITAAHVNQAEAQWAKSCPMSVPPPQ